MHSTSSCDISENTPVKTALIVEGGGMRGVFSAGVLDAFLDKRHRNFDAYYGVSAGALNLLSFINAQRGRNLDIYTGACLDPKFISIKRHLKGGNLFDLDWFFDRIGRLYLDQGKFLQSLKGKSFTIVTTCSNTGYPVYHRIDEHSDLDQLFEMLKASSALPMIYRQPIDIDGRQLVDGTMADPLPIMKAVEDGHQHIVLIRTRESNYRKTPSSANRLMAWQFRKQPELAQLIREQYRIYNDSLDQIEQLKQQGIRITEIAPQSKLACTRSTRNRTRLVSDYHRGYSEGYALLNQAHINSVVDINE
ncbi:patatin family protein [Endozoicomonas sp. OPT23]|uniref:patatin-like phospholipase family protein n=1 Tax=Endozoicomonas sp. OPT23 TaxID=2072845 RepID=UPI00129AEBD7|nr:patatin family protein [Endozoicomonas sp. OPT23]MRI35048.1 patatin family protein [Endozoicomonas sp. OPT23]